MVRKKLARFLFYPALLLISFFFTYQLFAQSPEDCLSIQIADQRLSCYDSALGFSSSLPLEPEVISTGPGWQLMSARDPFSGEDTSSALLESDRAGMSGVSRGGYPTAMVVRCDGRGGAEIFVMVRGYIGGRDRVRVRYMFGDSEPMSENWTADARGRGAFLPSSFRDFRRGLESGRDFVFEVVDFSGVGYTANFHGAGRNREAFEYAYGGCR